MKKTLFISFTILLGIILDIMPLGKNLALFRPYWTLMIVIFWALYLRNSFGIGSAWLAGLILDISKNYLLGAHGFIFALTAYLIKRNYHWLRELSIVEQSLLVVSLFAFQGLAVIVMNGFLNIPNVHVALAAIPIILSSILWPLLSGLLSELSFMLQIDEKK